MKGMLLKCLILLALMAGQFHARADERQFSALLPSGCRFERELSGPPSRRLKTEVQIFSVNQKTDEVKRFLERKGIILKIKNQAGIPAIGIYQDWVVEVAIKPNDKNASTLILTKMVRRGGMVERRVK